MGTNNLEFRKIPSLKFLYEVSEDGRFLRNVKSKKYLKIVLDHHHSKAGYYMSFVNIRGKVIRVPIHKVVAECWLGPIPEGREVDHKDRNTHNNHYTNLRYVTHSEQMKNRTLSPETIEHVKNNCAKYIQDISVSTTVSKDDESFSFRSMTQAAEFLSEQTGKKAEHIRSKMKERRKYIYGYDVSYRNAETVRVGPKGQETVQ